VRDSAIAMSSQTSYSNNLAVVPQNLIRGNGTQRVARTARGVADEFAVSAALIDLIKSDATLHEGDVFDPALLAMATPKLHAADFV
jgi:response regulator RpfG family c-di-GMP phosphodiesterase